MLVRNLIILFLLLFYLPFITQTAAEDPGPQRGEDRVTSVDIPINLYDDLEFDDELSGYIRAGLYLAGPTFAIVYGISTWGWSLDKGYTYNPETCYGDDAVHGAADKYGHLYAAFIVKRFSSFLFRSTGSSRARANIEGAIFSEIIMASNEIGDGFSPDYGFDPYDFIFNNIGILIGMLLDWSPFLDRIFALQIEYYPTKDMREKFDFGSNHDLPTDYGGTKFILSTKFAGIPYISLTPLRYINFDFGYYSRGFDQNNYRTKTRNVYAGLSVNLSIAFADLLPVGYTSSTLQTCFNYIHLPWDYEMKREIISEIPK